MSHPVSSYMGLFLASSDVQSMNVLKEPLVGRDIYGEIILDLDGK